ncbi:MAG: MBL fold metallo-hydrolase [Bacteroidota bacterium]
MKVTFLGTGTSQGVPVIGCDCEVCQSPDPHDKRLRPSILLQHHDLNLVIDTGPDFRQQMLRAGVQKIEAVLLTHEHNDHIIGIDDVRPFNFRYRLDMPVYADPRVQAQLRERFAYIFAVDGYPGIPRLELRNIEKSKRFEVNGLSVLPIEVIHGRLPVLGFRFGDFTYITDAKYISEASQDLIKGSKILVLNALHHQMHYSHFNLEEALEMIAILQPERAYLTHISHYMGLHREVNAQLPAGVQLAHDGLELEIDLA